MQARLPVPYLVPHECVDARLIPSSADAEFSERSSVFLIEGHGIACELFGVPGHDGGLPILLTQPDWRSGVRQTGVSP